MVLQRKEQCTKRRLKNKNLIIFSFAPFLRGFFYVSKLLIFFAKRHAKTSFLTLPAPKNLTFSQLFSGDPTSPKLRTRRTSGFILRATPPFAKIFDFVQNGSSPEKQNPLLNFHNFKIGADFKICKNRSFYIIN